MMSLEAYEEAYLEGKTKQQLLTTIRGLKQKMGRLKNVIENPEYRTEANVCTREDISIHWTRIYLERAKQAYTEAYGTYVLSKSEEKTADFDANIDAIDKLTFTIGGFSNGHRNYVVELTDGLQAYTELWDEKESLSLWDKDNGEPFVKETFIAALKKLHMGEWRRRYSTERFGYMVCDGTQWELDIDYNNGHQSVSFSGSNSYPYNFGNFSMLFDGDSTSEIDE